MTRSLMAQKSKKGESLGAKIELLKEVTQALTREVTMLDRPIYVDVRRGVDLHEEMKRYEVSLIQEALQHTGGNQVRAARLLNLNTSTLNAKIKRFNITPDGKGFAVQDTNELG